MTDKNINAVSDVIERLLTNKVADPGKMTNQELEGLGIHAAAEIDPLQTDPPHRPVQKSFQRKGPEFSREDY